jgi:ribosomal protein S18 acetylase RimI-like enzyme
MISVPELERAAVRALPPLETTVIDGWHLSIGRGEVGRLNSVTTFGMVPMDPLDVIERVESRYWRRRRPARFRLTHLDETIDDLLSARGYERSVEVEVMAGAVTGNGGEECVEVTRAVTTAWVEDFTRISEGSEARSAEIVESLRSLALPHGAFRVVGRAVGVAVVDGRLVGLFDLAVAPRHRRSGLGRAVSRAMLDWGGQMGAETAWLQVLADNQPARGLYAGLGFETVYRYWYRQRSRPGDVPGTG